MCSIQCHCYNNFILLNVTVLLLYTVPCCPFSGGVWWSPPGGVLSRCSWPCSLHLQPAFLQCGHRSSVFTPVQAWCACQRCVNTLKSLLVCPSSHCRSLLLFCISKLIHTHTNTVTYMRHAHTLYVCSSSLLCMRTAGYSQALSQFLLKKFLLLVFFLDRAKLTRLIDHDPCLFCVDAEIKVQLMTTAFTHTVWCVCHHTCCTSYTDQTDC